MKTIFIIIAILVVLFLVWKFLIRKDRPASRRYR